MPSLVLTAGQTRVVGDVDPPPTANNGPRKSLVVYLVSGDACFGWTDTVTAAGATDAGIPLVVGNPIAFDAENFRFNGTLRVFSTAGCTLYYQENKHP